MTDPRDFMTQEQIAQLHEPMALQKLPTERFRHPIGSNPFAMTGHFHVAMGMKIPETPEVPSVSKRMLRASLILEEFLELLDAMGLELIAEPDRNPQAGVTVYTNDGPAPGSLFFRHIEESRYDLVETADALSDLNVVIAGSAVEFGIPLHFTDYEVYCSNLSKLDSDGHPIINHCRMCGPNPEDPHNPVCDGDSSEHWIKPDAPLGKILKPEGFVKANIPRALMAHYNEEI